jgi:hypothetical protein
MLRYAGLLDESAKECDTAFAIDPYGLRSCAVTFIELGDYSRARDYIHTDEGSEWANALTIQAFVRQGKKAEALRITGTPHSRLEKLQPAVGLRTAPAIAGNYRISSPVGTF